MLAWDSDLRLSGADLFFDSRISRSRCLISHAHSDHIACHAHAIATPATLALSEQRVGVKEVTALQYRQAFELSAGVLLELLPAGHVLGSAMALVKREGQTMLYTGDYKLRPSLTVETAELAEADVLVMESTYGQPFFRFPRREQVAEQLLHLVAEALRQGIQPIVMGYSLGKAQEATRILTDAKIPVTVHGAAYSIHQTYEKLGVSLGNYRRYARDDFHGPRALDLQERGVLIAPPNVARSTFATRFERSCKIVLTGWSLLSNAKYRYGVDHALPMSDHADFDELLETVERVRPKKIFTHHGFREFADILKSKGYDATPARPDEQLQLFE